MMNITVIIPTYNNARYLPEAIESVLGQTYPDVQIIIVDDGSTDQVGQVITPYQNCVTFLQQANRGPGAARNRGLQNALGKYTVFLDADDVFLPGKLELQAFFLDQHPEVDVVYSNGYCFQIREDGREERRMFSENGYLIQGLGAPGESLEILVIQNAFPLHAAMARTSVLLEVGGFDEYIPALEDWDLWYRVAEAHTFAYLNAVVVKYRTVASGISANRARQKAATARLFEKIEHSTGFRNLRRPIQSDFYFCWGIMALEYQDTQTASIRFCKALAIKPRNHLARFAYYATRIFGKRAIIFYHFKRRWLGARGSHSSTGAMI